MKAARWDLISSNFFGNNYYALSSRLLHSLGTHMIAMYASVSELVLFEGIFMGADESWVECSTLDFGHSIQSALYSPASILISSIVPDCCCTVKIQSCISDVIGACLA